MTIIALLISMILTLIIKGPMYNALTILDRPPPLICLLLIRKMVRNLVLSKNKDSLLDREYKLYIKWIVETLFLKSLQILGSLKTPSMSLGRRLFPWDGYLVRQ
jgi:hypothetical protein